MSGVNHPDVDIGPTKPEDQRYHKAIGLDYHQGPYPFAI